MPYCIYTDREWPVAELSEEHVVPHAMGGSSGLAISVNRKVNSDLGSQVDAPVINDPVMQWFRSKHSVRSRSGVLEKVRFTAFEFDGQPVPECALELGADGLAKLVPHRKVERLGEGEFLIRAGGQEELVKIAGDLARKHGDYDLVDQGKKAFAPTTMSFRTSVPAYKRFFAKLALSAAYRVIGDKFRLTSHAATLRRLVVHGPVQETDFDLVELKLFTVPGLHQLFITSDIFRNKHLIALERTRDGLVLWISVFGFIGAQIAVSHNDLTDDHSDSRGLLLLADWCTRQVTALPLSAVEGRLGVPVSAFMPTSDPAEPSTERGA